MSVFASATLAFTAWGFAGVIGWTVHVMLAGGILTFISALLSRGKSTAGGRKVITQSHYYAMAFSALFLLYLVIQAFNPSIMVAYGDGGWWVEKMSPPLAAWLPTSVRSNYEPMNAFRVLEFFSGSFLLMWGILVGITRRQPALIILWSLVLSGSGMAFVAIIQSITESDKVLWALKSANPLPWGSFFYRNQGAAYLNLILIATGVLYFYYAKRSIERVQHGGPHFLLFLLFALLVSSVAMALSRGGILFGGILTVGFLALALLQRIFIIFNSRNSWLMTSLTGLLLIVGVCGIAKQVDVEAIQERFGDIGATIENAESDARAISSQATWEMARDNLWHGWGAGSFRYVFPIYQQQHLELFYTHYNKSKGEWRGRRVYYYAHNDILQFIAEYGLIGCGLLVLTLVALLAPVLRQLFSVSAFQSVYIFLGLVTIAGHAFLDFILNSPAYWVAFVGLLAAVAKFFTLERLRSRPRHSHSLSSLDVSIQQK